MSRPLKKLFANADSADRHKNAGVAARIKLHYNLPVGPLPASAQ